MSTTGVEGFGFFTPPGDDNDDGGRDEVQEGAPTGLRRIVPGIALRPLEGQRLQTVELTGDGRFLPIEELDARVDRLREGYGGDDAGGRG
jgi:hypothetical protein